MSDSLPPPESGATSERERIIEAFMGLLDAQPFEIGRASCRERVLMPV